MKLLMLKDERGFSAQNLAVHRGGSELARMTRVGGTETPGNVSHSEAVSVVPKQCQ